MRMRVCIPSIEVLIVLWSMWRGWGWVAIDFPHITREACSMGSRGLSLLHDASPLPLARLRGMLLSPASPEIRVGSVVAHSLRD